MLVHCVSRFALFSCSMLLVSSYILFHLFSLPFPLSLSLFCTLLLPLHFTLFLLSPHILDLFFIFFLLFYLFYCLRTLFCNYAPSSFFLFIVFLLYLLLYLLSSIPPSTLLALSSIFLSLLLLHHFNLMQST